MTPQEVLDKFGGPRKSVRVAAKAIGRSHQTLYDWLRKGVISDAEQARLQLDTKGRLRRDEP